jgi:predicted ATP-grasp superfamily ATP-dependent carboligase
MHPAIVMYMGPTGLGVTRSIGKLGVPVIGLDQDSESTGLVSKFCTGRIIVKDPVIFPEACLETLINFGKKLSEKAVLLPTADSYVQLVSENAHVLSEYFLFNVPEYALLQQIMDKKKQYALAEKHNIPIARTYAPESPDDLDEIVNTLRFPLFIKGLTSALWGEKYKKKGFLVHNVVELRDQLSAILAQGVQPIVQEVIPGANHNHFKVCTYYAGNGELKCVFSTHKARQYPVDFGIGTYMKSSLNRELIDLSIGFLEKIGYRGVGSIEYKLDDRDNQYKYIELNPRFWQQNIQSTYAGINFALANYNDCIGEAVDMQDKFSNDVIWIDGIGDFRSFLKSHRMGQISTREWLKSLRHIACFSYFDKDDLKPLVSRLAQVLMLVLFGRRGRSRMLHVLHKR